MNTNSPNNHNEHGGIAPERVARLLTYAAQRIDDDTVAALRQAHNKALDRQLLKQPAFTLSTEHGMSWLMPHSSHQWVGMIILLVAILFGGVNYLQHTHENDISHLDTAILTDDLPLEVFVD